MSMTSLVQSLEDKGRNGDTILAHINPEEAQLLKDHGGSGTINPETGIMEFNIFSDLWDGFKSAVKTLAPVIIPAVAIFVPALIPAIGTYLGASAAMASVVGAAALSAGVTLAAGGSLKDVLTSAALAGASTYLTPIVGKALTFDGASQLSQIMAGSAAVGAGYTAMRGGSVQQMLAAAATGATSAYLGNLAREGVAKMNNMMASGKVSGTITEKGATDATFVAADAANLKAAGLTESEIAATLKASGVQGTAADYAAKSVTNGMDTSTLAANIAANSTNGVYSGAANTKAIIAGNNIETMQRVEDAQFLAEDATQLRQQGLSKNDIVQNLKASGVSDQMANYAADKAISGMDATKLSEDLISQSTFLTSGKVYTNTTDTIARNLGEAMTPEQAKEFKALPFKELVNNGSMTIEEASILGQNNVTPQQANDLIKLGYTASDLDNLISAGVQPSTLTNLANTKFPETQINSMLSSGVSANDISNASIQVANGKLSTTTAESLLKGGISGSEIAGVALSGKADQVANLFDKGMSEDTFKKMYFNGDDFGKVNAGVTNGQINVSDLNNNVATNNNYKNWITQQLASTPVKPTQPAGETVTQQPVQPTQPTATQVTQTDFQTPAWAEQINQYVPGRMVDVTLPDGSQGLYDMISHNVYNLNGDVITSTGQLSTGPGTQVAETTTPSVPDTTTDVSSPSTTKWPGNGIYNAQFPPPGGSTLPLATQADMDAGTYEYVSNSDGTSTMVSTNVPQAPEPFIPVVTPPVVTPPVTPPVVTPPVAPQPPAAPTVVSSSTRTTMDGSTYKDDQMSDGTVTSTLVSGPRLNVGTTPAPTVPTTPQQPLSPPTQVVIPPGSSYVAPVEVNPPTTPTTPTQPEVPVTPPYIPIPTEPIPTAPPEGSYSLRWGTPPIANIPTGLNPGWITDVPQFYKPTNQAQSQYYWGAHPYQPGPTFDKTLYNQVPNAPVTPWGVGTAQKSASAQDVLTAMQGRYPLLTQTSAAPVIPT